MPLNLAMDGPVGAGKSTVADAVAARLGILHLDTGAMYRAIGLLATRRDVPLTDEKALEALCADARITVSHEADGQHTFLDGEDVSAQIRTQEISMAASTVSRCAAVRRAMVALQQRLASTTDMLLDGRDIGTRVLPDAPVKIFLTASPEERAKRRYLELQRKGAPDTYEQVLEELKRRDAQDMNRAVDPLRPAEDAVTVDTTGLSFDEVVDTIVRIVREKTNGVA